MFSKDSDSKWWGLCAIAILFVFGSIMIRTSFEVAKEGEAIQDKAMQEALAEGEEACLQGVPVEACPWTGRFESGKRNKWIRGWTTGFLKQQQKKKMEKE